MTAWSGTSVGHNVREVVTALCRTYAGAVAGALADISAPVTIETAEIVVPRPYSARMAVPSAYLTSTKNTAAIFEAIQRAAVPERFTFEFFKQLGFAASGDRPMIPVLKAIGFLNDASSPTPLYRQYKDKSIAKAVLAQAIRAGYADIFAIDPQADKLPSQDLAGIFARLSDKGESVTIKMATTFKALCALADFSATAVPEEKPPLRKDDEEQPPPPPPPPNDQPPPAPPHGVLSLRHDIHIHLPVSNDVAVYDAIFKSVKVNLL